MGTSDESIFHLLSLLMIMTLTAGCQSANLSEQQFTGLDKGDVVKMLGEPDEIEMGEKIVIWRYETSDGYKELYFLNDESEVAGEFYWYKDTRKNPVF